MTPSDAIRQALSRQPFRRFRIVLKDGRSFTVADPAQVKLRPGYEGEELRFHIGDTPADAPLLKEVKDVTYDPPPIRPMPVSEDTARHLLYLLNAAVGCSMDEYNWVGHDEVVALFRQYWPELFGQGEAFSFLKSVASPEVMTGSE